MEIKSISSKFSLNGFLVLYRKISQHLISLRMFAVCLSICAHVQLIFICLKESKLSPSNIKVGIMPKNFFELLGIIQKNLPN